MYSDSTMHYRRVLSSVLAATLLVIAAGCDSFLSPDPKSFSTTANFYQSQSDFEQGINGVYVEMRGLIGGDAYRNATDRRGPTLTKHFDVNLPNTVGGDPQTDEFTMVASNGNSVGLWADTYDLIKEANVILTRIGEVEFEDSGVKARIEGEARVMRAFAYWFAVQTWGGVPLMVEDPRTPDDAFPDAGRASVDAVYQQIISDLQAAMEGLPITYDGGEAGRITRGAAKMLLGRTYLLTGDYQSALSEFEDLDSAEYPYQLLGDFRSIFDPNNKNNAESIWEIQYNPSLAGQGELPVFEIFLPINAAEDLYPASRPIDVPDGDVFPTPDVIEKFEGTDVRFTEGLAWYVNPNNSSFPEIAWPPRSASAGTAPGDSIAYLNKFYFPNTVTSTGEAMNNWVLFRFADALLGAAEANWRMGNQGEAMNYLNRVRSRAGLGAVDLADYSGDWTGSALGDAILWERFKELLGEGHAWFDLKRMAGAQRTVARMRDHGERFRDRDPKMTTRHYDVQEYMLLYPIPPGDIDLAGLSQNPGW